MPKCLEPSTASSVPAKPEPLAAIVKTGQPVVPSGQPHAAATGWVVVEGCSTTFSQQWTLC